MTVGCPGILPSGSAYVQTHSGVHHHQLLHGAVDGLCDRIARKVEVDHHDMGFLYSPTCVAAWKLVGSEKGKNAAIAAADQLLTRYQPSGKFLQAWGTMDDPDNYRYIIDCMLNVPLLYWAGETTGNDHYREIAAKNQGVK